MSCQSCCGGDILQGQLQVLEDEGVRFGQVADAFM